jgi:hypothetical protein
MNNLSSFIPGGFKAKIFMICSLRNKSERTRNNNLS